MATPQTRPSKSRTRRRRSINMKLSEPQLVECGNCGNRIRPHRVCPKCGFYKGRQIIEPDDMA